MEQKKKSWMKKIIVIVVIIAAVASYYLIPSVKTMMNKVWGLYGCKRVCRILWSICGLDFIFTYDIPVPCGTSSGIFDYICKCQSFWMVARCNSFVDKCHGGSGSLLLRSKNSRA